MSGERVIAMSQEQRDAAWRAITHADGDGDALDALVGAWDAATVDRYVAAGEAAKYALRAADIEYPGADAIKVMAREIVDVLWPTEESS